jgi:hypothetical protein
LARTPRRDRRRREPGGIATEHALTRHLGHQRVRFGTSPLLDHVHKVDALIHEIVPISGFHEPIALQITQKRDDAAKIETFFEKAVGATKGSLLYAEIDGRATPSTAAGLRNALVALWLEIPRREEREHRVLIHSDGRYEWLPPRPKPKAKRPKT